MATKAENPNELLKDKDVSPILRLYFNLAHLKQVYRKGWLERGIPASRCESVAEHSYGVVMLALFLADWFPELDRLRVLQLALLHDFGEIHAGDITPADKVTREEKLRREADSFSRVLRDWPQGEGYLALFQEYERGESKEARFVRQLEKLEMALQAAVYQYQGLASLGEFLNSADEAIDDARLRKILEDLRRLLEERE
jgi:putative hydrolase of HD superfamily